jgi:mannitol-1-phosphate/altronate dehydrogenase
VISQDGFWISFQVLSQTQNNDKNDKQPEQPVHARQEAQEALEVLAVFTEGHAAFQEDYIQALEYLEAVTEAIKINSIVQSTLDSCVAKYLRA